MDKPAQPKGLLSKKQKQRAAIPKHKYLSISKNTSKTIVTPYQPTGITAEAAKINITDVDYVDEVELDQAITSIETTGICFIMLTRTVAPLAQTAIALPVKKMSKIDKVKQQARFAKCFASYYYSPNGVASRLASQCEHKVSTRTQEIQLEPNQNLKRDKKNEKQVYTHKGKTFNEHIDAGKKNDARLLMYQSKNRIGPLPSDMVCEASFNRRKNKSASKRVILVD